MDRQGGRYVVECDICGQVLDTDTDEFSDVILILKDNDWRSRKVEGYWEHYCEKCHD